jgi:hypothetical protein
MRTMFIAYLVVIVTGLLAYGTIGLMHQ